MFTFTFRQLPPAALQVATVCALTLPLAAQADEPGRGLTGPFEIEFMQFTIDHHFAALRITELAAGTDLQRNAAISSDEGTSPTPGFAPTQAKASLDDLKSLARRANRAQREEIMMLRQRLREWYGTDHQPRIRGESLVMIQMLERAAPGAAFNHAFYETFSRHHFTLMGPVNACITGSELRHFELRRMCSQMWHEQTSQIDEMRHELAKHFGIVDYQPFAGRQPFIPEAGSPRGHHSGREPQ